MRAVRSILRRLGASWSGAPLLAFALVTSGVASGQTPPAAKPAPEKKPPAAPEQSAPGTAEAEAQPAQPEAKEAPAPEAAEQTSESEAPAEASTEPTEESGDSGAQPASTGAEPAQPAPPTEGAAAPEPAAPQSARPGATAPVDPTSGPAPADDDYAGASDSALVEEKQGPKNLSLGVALDLTFPMGNSAKYIKSASIQGLSLDLRYYAWGNFGIGAGVALDSLSKKLAGTVTWDNATFTGTQVRELSYTPITLKGYYAWRDQGRVIPYVAAGVGAARSVRRLVVGISGLSEAAWHFAMVPEAGLQIPVGPTLLLTNVRLNYLPASGGVEDQMFANFSLGLSIQ